VTREALASNQITHIVQILCQRYKETNWLASRTNVTCEGNSNNVTVLSEKSHSFRPKKFPLKCLTEKATSNLTRYKNNFSTLNSQTIVSIFCILWVLEGEYEPFVACQSNPTVRLAPQSFRALRDYVIGILTCPDAIAATKAHFVERKNVTPELVDPKSDEEWRQIAYEEAAEALIVSTVLNDLGKVESVVQRVRARTAIEEVDHDKILLMGIISW
jgi:hypothetical protein